MKIVKLVAENVKKLKAIEIIPEGNVVKITGANEQGKTTVLDSIWWALGGTKGIQDQPIRTGEKKANITIDLGDMIVTRKFTESGSTLEVKNPQGLKHPKPQDMLDKLIGKFSFDPLAFAKADKKTQVDTLLGIVNISVDAEKLGALAGAVVQKYTNPLDTLNAVYKVVFEGRTGVNRDRDKAKANYESKIGAAETKAVSITELMSEKTEIEEFNKANDDQRKSLREMVESAKVSDLLHAELISNRESIESTLSAEMAELNRQLIAKTNELEEAIIASAKIIKDSSTALGGKWFSANATKEVVDTLEDKELTDINERITNADETNRKAREWDELQLAKAEYDKQQADSEDYTSRLEAVKTYKTDLMKAAKFPIEGLDFKNGGVFYQGLPFDQASSAQSLTVSLSIAMAINPDLRVIRVNDGSLLDKKHMAIMEKMAKDNDFQLWLECVDESGKVGIYIEDGEIKNVEEENERN